MTDYVPRNLQEWEAKVLRKVDHYIVTAFRGRGRFEKVKCPTLDHARKVAPTLYRGKPIGIYGVNPDGLAAHIENWEPERKIRRMKRRPLHGNS